MEDVGIIRGWAMANGIAIQARGRLPRRIVQLYADATSQNQEGCDSEIATRFELLAKHLEPRFGNIYEGHGGVDEGQAWTPELRQAVRHYLLVELPVSIRAAMFCTPDDREDMDAWEKEVDSLFDTLTISEISLSVRSAAVAAQTALDRVTGQSDGWPGGEDQKLDAEFWLEAHADEQLLREIATFLREGLRFHASPETTPCELIDRYSPMQLVKAWQQVVGPAPSELTDVEWRLLCPLLPPAKNSALEHVARRGVDGLLYQFVNKAHWHDIPRRYASYSALITRRARYKRYGVFRRALKALEGNPEAARLVEWLATVA